MFKSCFSKCAIKLLEEETFLSKDVLHPVLGYSMQIEEYGHTGQKDPWEAMDVMHCSISALRRGSDGWVCSALVSLCGISLVYTNMWSKGTKRLGQTLFRVSSDRIRGKEHKLKHRRFLLNKRKLFGIFSVRVTKHCYRLLSEKSPFLQIPRTHLAVVLIS